MRRAEIRISATARAFTLIELLVVVAIIALLLAIFTPSISMVRDLAMAAVCKSNLHQLGTAMQAYVASHGYYPVGHTWNKTHYYPQCVITWAPQMRLHADDENIFWCPRGEAVAKWEPTYGTGQPAEFGYAAGESRLYSYSPFSYGYNNWGTWDFATKQLGLGSMAGYTDVGDPDWGPLLAHRVVAPWDMLAIGDSKVDYSWDAFIDHNQPPEWPYDPHMDKTQIVFCDGHVGQEFVIDLVDATNPYQRKRWNNDNQPH